MKIKRKVVDPQRLERHKAFAPRVLADFAFQRRHILCGRYNNSTSRRLACAIIKIVTLDFTVVEATLPHQGTGGFLVWIHNLPKWDPLSGNNVQVGCTSIVICQHISHAITLLREDFAKQNLSRLERGPAETSDGSLTYLILSVRDIILYRTRSESERYTKLSISYLKLHRPAPLRLSCTSSLLSCRI